MDIDLINRYIAQEQLDTSEFNELIKLQGVSIKSCKTDMEGIEVFYSKKLLGKVYLSFR
jgi:propanediol dehydratase large subunit